MKHGPEIEKIRRENLPTPEQIGELAFKLFSFADRHDKLAFRENQLGVPQQVVKVIRDFESPSLDIPDVYWMQNTVSAYTDRDQNGTQRLRLFDSVHRKELGIDHSAGMRSVYEFFWNESETIDARREIVALPKSEELPLIDVIDKMMSSAKSPFHETDAVAVDLMTQIDHLTSADTEMLIKKIDGLIDDIDSGKRAYCEPSLIQR